MKIYLFFLIFLSPTIFFNSQTTVSGNVYNENQVALSGVLVVNINNDNQTLMDQTGYFLINARSGNELRFIRQNYERVSSIVNPNSIFFGLNITMVFAPTDIEEVKVSPKLSGNLAKDFHIIPINTKTQKLQQDIANSMKFKPVLTSVEPNLSIPSEFVPRDFSKGQLNLFDNNGGGVFGVITKLIIKKTNIPEPNFNETQDFLKKIKENINKNFYYGLGMTEGQLDQFLSDANFQLNLAKNFRNKFNINTLEKLLHDYVKTYSFKTTK